MEHDTVAGNPGGLTLSPIQWFKHFPVFTLVSLVLLASMVAGISIPKARIPVAVAIPILLFVNFRYWQRRVLHFSLGDANPGIVLATDPTLVAVYTNMSKVEGDDPVVKVIRAPARDLDGKPYRIGDVLPTVALYEDGGDELKWSDVDPVPAQAATANPEAVRRVLRRFTNEELERVRMYSRKLSKPTAPGLYWMEASDSQTPPS